MSCSFPIVFELLTRLFGRDISCFRTILGCGSASGSPASSVPSSVPSSAIDLESCWRLLRNHLKTGTLPSADPFGSLYLNGIPRAERLARGEFYTPVPLADWLLERVLRFRRSGSIPTILDPTCGSGVFLLAAIRRKWSRGCPAEHLMDNLVGLELNSKSVILARANLLFASLAVREDSARHRELDRLLGVASSGHSPFPVYTFDCLTRNVVSPCDQEPFHDLFPAADISDSFDVVIGNPPWINWDRLAPSRKNATLDLWRKYGLFTLTGKETRYGGAKKEYASLVVSSVADHFLRSGGLLGMLLPRSLFQTRLAGEGFRRFHLPEQNIPLNVHEIHDLSETSFFPGVMSRPSAMILTKGTKTTYPVPWYLWHKSGEKRRGLVTDFEKAYQKERLQAVPSDAKRCGSPLLAGKDILSEPGSPTSDSRRLSPTRESPSCPNQVCPNQVCPNQVCPNQVCPNQAYKAQLGCNTGGANGIFWLSPEPGQTRQSLWSGRNLTERGKLKVPDTRVTLESGLVYPLLTWSDVDRWSAYPKNGILLAQDPGTRQGLSESVLKERYPLCFRYLSAFERELRSRAIYRKYQKNQPFWSMYNVSRETMSPIKVVWRRMDCRIRAAVVLPDALTGKPVLPQETLVLIPVGTLEEADYLAAALNSEQTALRVAATGLAGTKGFGSPGQFALWGIERFDPCRPEHLTLSEIGRDHRERVHREQALSRQKATDQQGKPKSSDQS